MASPNPFLVANGYPSTFCSLAKASALPQPQPLRFADVPHLENITLRKGPWQYTVDPYSAQHALLTGHDVTPCARNRIQGTSTQGRPDTSPPYLDPPAGLFTSELATNASQPMPSTRGGEPVAFTLCLEAIMADVPESHPLLGLIGRSSGGVASNSLEEEEELDDPDSDSDSDTDTVIPETLVPAQPDRGDYVSEPAEWSHGEVRRQRSPYALRTANREVLNREIAEQAQATGFALDLITLQQAAVKTFNPSLPFPPTSVELLYRCGSVLAHGITLSQFGRIIKRCVTCEHYVFVDRCRYHSCDAPTVDVGDQPFMMADGLLDERRSGMTLEDLVSTLEVCDTCSHIYMAMYTDNHQCPVEE